MSIVHLSQRREFWVTVNLIEKTDEFFEITFVDHLPSMDSERLRECRESFLGCVSPHHFYKLTATTGIRIVPKNC